MVIAICGSMKFHEKMIEIKRLLEESGHQILMPVKVEGVDYWSDDNKSRVKARGKKELIKEHFREIEKSDAILIINITKGEIKNYIGANTFLELGFAHYLGKRIYLLNSIPDQMYIIDEVLSVKPIVLQGDLSKIK